MSRTEHYPRRYAGHKEHLAELARRRDERQSKDAAMPIPTCLHGNPWKHCDHCKQGE